MHLGEEECYIILSLSLSLGKGLLLLFLLPILGLISVMWGSLSVFSQQVKQQFLSDWNQLCSTIELSECLSLLILKILGKKFTNDSDKILKGYIFLHKHRDKCFALWKKMLTEHGENHKMGNNIVWKIWCIKEFTHDIKYEGDGYPHFSVGLHCVSGWKFLEIVWP